MSRLTHNRSFQRRVFPGNHVHSCSTGTGNTQQTRKNTPRTPKTQNKQAGPRQENTQKPL